MAEQIVVWCDRCLTQDTQVTGTPLPVTLDGTDWRVDLCEHCREELVAPLSAILESMGQKLRKGSPSAMGPTTSMIDLTRMGPSTKTDPTYFCLICPSAYVSSSSLSNHYQHEHGVPNGLLSYVYGTQCPRCGAVFETYQGVSMHCTRTYQVPVTKLFLEARGASDTHGVVKQAMERLAKVVA